MSELVLKSSLLPEPIQRLIRTNEVRVSESSGVVQLFPVEEQADDDCPLYGMYSGGELTVEKFLQWKKEDKELEL